MKNWLAIILIFSASLVFSQENCLLDAPAPKHLVVDIADILSPSVEQKLENALVAFNRETSNQILVVTVNDLCGYDKAEFTYSLGENWGVGQKEFDNGIVLMVKPRGKAGDRHTFIAVGYGLEGAIPDAISKRIVEVELIPRFKQGDFEGGIISGVSVLMGLAKGEISVQQYQKQSKKGLPVFSFLFIIAIIFFLFFSNIRRVQRNSVGKNLTFWAALMLLSSSGHRSGGGWNSFHSGGGSFGGGGGGFGGFGGGGFGGGGAGGSW